MMLRIAITEGPSGKARKTGSSSERIPSHRFANDQKQAFHSQANRPIGAKQARIGYQSEDLLDRSA